MQRLRSLLAVALVAVGFTCFAGGAQASGKAAKNTSDWKLMGAAGDVKAGGMYTLVNVTDGESIRYGDRRWGVNIVWDKSTKLNNVKLDRKGGAGPLKYGDVEKISGNKVKQAVTVRQGVEQELAKKIVKTIKESKMKVQGSIQGDVVRVSGGKRDDLQSAIALIKQSITDFPLQYKNFRD